MPARISMTKKQRDVLLALPETENEIVRHYTLDAKDLTAIASCRTPETRLSHALQLCCLRYPGRHLRPARSSTLTQRLGRALGKEFQWSR